MKTRFASVFNTIFSLQKYFEWYEKMTSQCEQLKREGYRGEKVDQLASDLSNAYSQTLGRAKNREKLLHTTLQFHKQKKTVSFTIKFVVFYLTRSGHSHNS